MDDDCLGNDFDCHELHRSMITDVTSSHYYVPLPHYDTIVSYNFDTPSNRKVLLSATVADEKQMAMLWHVHVHACRLTAKTHATCACGQARWSFVDSRERSSVSDLCWEGWYWSWSQCWEGWYRSWSQCWEDWERSWSQCWEDWERSWSQCWNGWERSSSEKELRTETGEVTGEVWAL